MSDQRATADFESRSACPLKKTGSWKYSLDPSTEILCLGFRLPTWKKGRTALWNPAFPHLGIEESGVDELVELFNWIISGGELESHNRWFDFGIWKNIAVPRLGWPDVPPNQWLCSAAKAAAHALPRSLDDAAAALGLKLRKDTDGTKVMMKLNKPRKPRKKEVEDWIAAHGKKKQMPQLWHESKELFEILFDYCRQDVLVEEAVSNAIPDLSPEETQLYLLDQKINERGFLLDMEAVDVALDLIADETSRLNAELKILTGGSPDKATQRKKMHDWFLRQWVILEDTKSGTVDEALNREDLDPKVRRGLELLQTLSRSSTAKFEAKRNWACRDGRVRGSILFHGASTGRAAGAGPQPQNYPRGTVRDIEGAWTALKTRDRTTIEAFIPDPEKPQPIGDTLKLLSQSLRGTIIAPPGKKLLVSDFAQIEVRVLFWMAGEDEALEMLRTGKDIYCDVGSDIYGRTITKADKVERHLAKATVLGCGYGLGWNKFQATMAAQGVAIDDEFAQKIIEIYRSKFHRVRQFWYDQEEAAGTAVAEKREVSCGYFMWYVDGQFLYCVLPSGRRLSYPFPAVKIVTTSWGARKPALTYMGVNAVTRKWQRESTYGGKICENLSQSVSRDLLMAALLRIEESGSYKPVLSVHDEVLAEANEHMADIEEFNKLMATVPLWAEGIPVGVEGFVTRRYTKG